MSTGVACDLSLTDTLVRAHEIREIFDESPLVTVALHRLLLAILHRNFGPPGRKAWFDHWTHGRWDAKKLENYFSRWRERFDLFHPKHPFYQVREIKDADRRSVAVLFKELAAGNNATLFDHSFEADPPAVPVARAARGVIASQLYSVGFGRSQPFYFADSPLLRGFTVLVSGKTLFETLALNLIHYDDDHPTARTHNREDLPAWEQDHGTAPRKEGNRPAGYLDYLTWQSRRIHLYLEPDGASVRFCQLQQNLKLADDAPRDPFKCYRKDEKRGWVAQAFREERALWRDSHTLMELSTESHNRPAVLDWVALLAAEPGARQFGVGPYFSFSVCGLATGLGKAASVTFWRHERLLLPLAYLNNAELLGKLGQAIGYAEEVAGDLRQSVWTLARIMFQPLDSEGGLKPSEDANRLAKELGPARLYWPALEAPFFELMVSVAELKRDEQESRLLEWRRFVRRIAREGLQQITRELDRGARALRAVAAGERAFWSKIREGLAAGEEL